MATTTLSIEAIAAECLAALEGGPRLTPFTARLPGFDLAQAYRVTAALRRLRQARGDRKLGRKIGFTNRTIWNEYGVYAPIWGDMWDKTVRALADCTSGVALAGFAEPRLEPEIAFGIARAPAPDMDEAALLGCVDWIAHGFEIVQSPFPGWRFQAPDTVAVNGLHGACLLGPRKALRPADAPAWLAALARFTLTLARDGTVIDHGRAENVLGGPLSALKHLVGLLARDPGNPPLTAGEIVTTGTLTRAFPIAPGEAWRTAPAGIALDGIAIRFV
jgi:2-oxo-3-hexenedioate decarboxylase